LPSRSLAPAAGRARFQCSIDVVRSAISICSPGTCSRTWSSIILAESCQQSAPKGSEVLPEVTFYDADECFERSYDMVIASNSLRYEEDWQQLLRQLVHGSANSAFLTHVRTVRQQHSFVVLQRAHRYGYATEYLGWVLNRDEVLRAARTAGLELERELGRLPELTVAGAPEPFPHSGLLFRADRS
jgi:hypothetical protein